MVWQTEQGDLIWSKGQTGEPEARLRYSLGLCSDLKTGTCGSVDVNCCRWPAESERHQQTTVSVCSRSNHCQRHQQTTVTVCSRSNHCQRHQQTTVTVCSRSNHCQRHTSAAHRSSLTALLNARVETQRLTPTCHMDLTQQFVGCVTSRQHASVSLG